MEDVLDVYHRPIDPLIPLVCLDEFCKQLVSEVALPIEPKPKIGVHPGTLRRQDYEYVREGSASGFMIAVPHLGTREVFIGSDGRRTSLDYAEAIEFLCDVMFPEVAKIVLVQDNLNTHGRASLYKKFEPEKANRLSSKIEWHYTPKHGSWLNIAEIEISILGRTGLAQRIKSLDDFRAIVQANITARNANPSPVHWSFDNEAARIKLRRLYPSI